MNTITEKIFSALVLIGIIFSIWFFWGRDYLNRNTNTIRIGFTHETMEAMTIAALQNNFYKDQGLVVEVKEYETGKQAIEGLLRNEIQIAPSATTPFIISTINGNKLKVISVISHADDQLKVLTRKSSNILKLNDLKGKRIGVEKGTAAHYFMSKIIEKYLVQEDTIQYVFASSPQDLISLIMTNKVDAISIKDPYFSQAVEKLGKNGVVFNPTKINTKTFQLVSSESFINNNPSTIEKYLKALVQAEALINIKTDMVKQQYEKYPSVSQDQINSQWDTTTFQLHMDDFFLDELSEQGNWALANGLTKNKVLPDVKTLMYTEGLRKAKPQGQFLDF